MNTKNKLNIGRSMIEMLGVLAIIGVLSVGAVFGLRQAFGRLDASGIQASVHMIAITASQQRMDGKPISLSEIFSKNENKINSKYPLLVKENYDGNDRFFTLSVTGIPFHTCKSFLHLQTFANRTELNYSLISKTSVCNDSDNVLSFVFANDLDKKMVAEPYNPNKDSAGDCKTGFTGDNCEQKDTTCSGNGVYDALADFAYCACNEGYGGNNCEATCPSDKYPLLSISMSNKQYDGGCHSCESNAWSIPAAECEKCPNRNGVRFVSDRLGLCLPCSFPDGVPSSEDECNKCGSLRTYSNKNCILNACDGFRQADGTCLPCSVEGNWETNDEAGCRACSGREYFNGICYAEKCLGSRNDQGECTQ